MDAFFNTLFDQWPRLLGLFVLFVLSAFFSGSETALMSIDRLRVKYLVEKDLPGARRLEALLDRPESLLSAILVGNNLVNIAVSVFATALFIELFGARGQLMTILVLTPLLLVFAEICPKTLAANYAERVSFMVLHPIRFVLWILKPIVWVLSGISRLLASLFRRGDARPLISEDEIRTMIEFGEQSGVVHREKRRMLHGVFNLAEMRARDVMVPRTELVGIEVGTPFAEVVSVVASARHSRFPVYEAELDNIVGVIHSKDILSYVGQPEDFSLKLLARPPYFVPEAKSIEALLQAFRRKHLHLAVVVDEYGGVEGIVTLEDIVEEIVGEIQDEYDDEEILIRQLGPNRYLIDGSAPLRDVNQRFSLNLAEEHVNTLAGFVMNTLGSIPEEGDQCSYEGAQFIVRRMVDKRVEEIEMLLPELSPE